MSKEDELKSDLAACHRLLEYYGMGDTIYTHVSARLDDAKGAFITTPYGLMFDEVRAEDLIALDLNGRVLNKTGHPVNAAGFVIHSAIYANRPDVGCVIHTHTVAGVAVSALKEGLLPISQAALEFYNRIGYHDYEGLATDFAECDRIVKDLGKKSALIMRNHGLVVAGPSIPAAFETMYYLEQACRIQLAAMAGGRELIVPPEAVCEHTAKQHEITGVMPKGARLWKAMLKKLEKLQQ
jgi:ribulose-5-phosphate 4-epimerase/fuculose-1-phosphate aldolase